MDKNLEAMTTEQAAAMMKSDKRTLDNWRSLGKGPAYIKVSKRLIRYLVADVENYMMSNRIEPVNN